MKKALCILVVGLVSSYAAAAVVGTWVVDRNVSSSGYDRFTYNITSDVNLLGFDVKVVNPANNDRNYWSEDLEEWVVFSTSTSLYCKFKNNGSASNISVGATEIDTDVLAAAFAAKPAGIYPTGFGLSWSLLQIVVPTSANLDPEDLLLSSTIYPMPKATIGTMGGQVTMVDIVPEPATMSLLGIGALALLRRRK